MEFCSVLANAVALGFVVSQVEYPAAAALLVFGVAINGPVCGFHVARGILLGTVFGHWLGWHSVTCLVPCLIAPNFSHPSFATSQVRSGVTDDYTLQLRQRHSYVGATHCPPRASACTLAVDILH